MKLKALVPGQTAVLRLWKQPSFTGSKSWNVFVDMQAAGKVAEDQVKQLMKERSEDEVTLFRRLMLAHEARLQGADNQFAVNSDYFKATVVEIAWDSRNYSSLDTLENFELSDTDERFSSRFAEEGTIRMADIKVASLSKDEFVQLEIGRTFCLAVLGIHSLAGMDGTTYGLQMGDSWRNLQIEWWQSGPTEWRELTGWALKTMKYLEERIAAQSNSA